MNNKYKSFLINYYLTSSLYDFIFAYAIYNVLFSIRGLSVFQISILFSWWALTAMILEIPSGALADYWSRKKMLILAPLLKSICFILWFFADGNFYLYGLGFLFWNFGSAFVSGTSEALLYDNLVAFEKKNDYEKVLGKKKVYFHIALAISIISGGFIANYSLDYAVIASVIPLLFSAFFATKLHEAPKTESTEEIHYLEYMKLAYKEVKSNKLLLVLLVYSFGISIFGDIEEFDQLYYEFIKLPIYAFGIIGFLWSILNAFGSNFAHKFKDKVWIFYVFPFVGAILLFLVDAFASIPMIVLLLLSYFLMSPLRVLIDSKIQHNIKSVSRATVTSVSTLLIQVMGFILFPFFGFLANKIDITAIYGFTAIILVLLSVWVFVKRDVFKKA